MPSKNSLFEKKTLLMLATVFIISCIVKYNMVFSQAVNGSIIDWGDEWSFLSQIEIIKITGELPVEDLFFGGIPYVYPPLSLMIYALLYMIIPIGYVSLANNVMPAIGSLAVVSIFYLVYTVTKDRNMGILAAYLSLFSPRYMALSSVPIPEMIAHLLAPIFMLLVYKMVKTREVNYAFLAGIGGASIILTHHLTTAVVFLPVFLYIALISVRKMSLTYVKLLVVMLSVAFLFSSPWWIDTVNKDIMNLVVTEGEDGPPAFNTYLYTFGPHLFYLGMFSMLLFFIYGIMKGNEFCLLIFSWGAVAITATRSRTIARQLFGSLIEENPKLLFVFAPIYGTRFFDYMAQPFAIMAGVVLVSALYALFNSIEKGTRNTKKARHLKIGLALFILVPLVISTMQFGFDTDKNWALRSLRPDVDNGYEYQASLEMRELLAEDANIITDYPGGAVVTAGTLRKITTGSELRSTVDIVPRYLDVIGIYYTTDVDEAIMLMDRWDATHVYISDRMIERGWFSVERYAKYPKFKNHGLADADLEKFERSDCFKKVYDANKVVLYELVC